ncbi:MAG: hypothetical protein KAW45_08205 [Thermoplasmatales archaeon]|nr:hypothetical protein [Thermoplasmatales archaeon]
MGIHELPEYEGKQVIVVGTVISYRTTRQGSQIIKIKENNATATIFVGGAIELEFGDKLKAIGEVQKYKDAWEIIIDDIRLVEIVEKWNNISFPLWQLAQSPARYLDLNVNVTGYIESVSNAYFYLVDLEEKHSLIVFYRIPENVTIYPGQKVSILGKFSFDEETFRYQLEIYDEKHGIFLVNQE